MRGGLCQLLKVQDRHHGGASIALVERRVNRQNGLARLHY
jgi:hypothetical protein